MYTEASSPQSAGDKARLISAVFSPVIPPRKCTLSFFYLMYGKTIGTLTVYTRTAVNGALTKVYSKSGESIIIIISVFPSRVKISAALTLNNCMFNRGNRLDVQARL